MVSYPFKQVDVFSSQRYGGNPVAVVLGAEDLSTEEMQRFASWTNLSETTFLLPPKNPMADYALRIFTNTRELPFAGHPTLGSCHAWLENGGVPQDPKQVMQECEQGLICIRRNVCSRTNEETLAFLAPPLNRAGLVDPAELEIITTALGLLPGEVVAHSWCDNGPPWIGLLLKSADRILSVNPSQTLLGGRDVGIIGPLLRVGDHEGDESDQYDFEVRAFCPLDSPFEDPATGSLNAGLAQWLLEAGLAPKGGYEVRQGTVVGRTGRIKILVEGEEEGMVVWVGGTCSTCISGIAQF